MQLILKLVAISVVIMFFLLGLGAYINPTMILNQDAFSWSPNGIAGLSGIRSVIGGHFLGLAMVAIYAFMKSKYKLFYIIALSEFLIAMGRIVSLGLDGYDSRVLVPLGVEIYMACAMFFAAKSLKSPSLE